MEPETNIPWTVETNRRTSFGNILPPLIKQGAHVIATVEGSEYLYDADDDCDAVAMQARDEANARLMAAATAALAAVEAFFPEDQSWHLLVFTPKELLALRDIIARAKGKTT